MAIPGLEQSERRLCGPEKDTTNGGSVRFCLIRTIKEMRGG